MPQHKCLTLSLLCAVLGCTPASGTIGAVLGQQPDGKLFVRDTPTGLAAEKHGLRTDDEILLIDGRDVRFMDEKQLHAALSGPVDSSVKLTVIRDDRVFRVTLKRTTARRLPAPAR